jgi:hypothetical protein
LESLASNFVIGQPFFPTAAAAAAADFDFDAAASASASGGEAAATATRHVGRKPGGSDRVSRTVLLDATLHASVATSDGTRWCVAG